MSKTIERLRAFIASQDDTQQQDMAWNALNRLESELAEARALLQEAISSVNTHAFSSADRLADRIEAFLAGKDAT